MNRLLIFLLAATSCFARVTKDASPRWIILTPDNLPVTALEQNLAPWIDGWMVRIDAADGTNQQIATDTTVCTTAPCTQTNSFATLDADVTAANSLATMTCGATLHGNAGHPCWVNFSLRPISNPTTWNLDTPLWVFSQAWATTVGSAVQDAVFCAGYPQNGSQVPLAPTTGTANINSTNCGSGSTACTLSTLATGLPAYFETPYLAFRKGWLQQFFAYLSTASYLSQVKYVSLAIGTGDENTMTCGTIALTGGTGMEALVSGQNDSGLKNAFLGAISSYVTYADTVRRSLGLNFALVGRFSPGVGLTSPSSTDPSWALLEADYMAALPNAGIGSNGWKNYSTSGVGSDLIYIVGQAANCVTSNSPPCTSNNWGQAIPREYGKLVYIIAQECNVSTPAGGGAACQDASQSGTGAQADTEWQWLTLAGAAGVNVIEVASKEAQCYSNVTPQSPCASGNAIQLAYQGAMKAWANGQIPINH